MNRRPRRTKEQIQADNEAKDRAKKKNKLAKFIVQKYVLKSQINWARDVKMGQDLADKFPKAQFWEQLPCRFQVKALSGIMTEKSLAFLMREWLKYSVVIPAKFEYKLEEGRIGEDKSYEPLKPKSLLEFFKYAKTT